MELPAAMCTFLAIDASKDLCKQSLWEMCFQGPRSFGLSTTTFISKSCEIEYIWSYFVHI